MISIDIEKEPDPNWNKRLLNSDVGTIYQTQEYGLYTSSILGWQTDYLKFINQKGEIIGQLLLSTYSRFDKRGNIGKILKNAPGLKQMICRWIYGPVIFNSEYNVEICKSLYDFLISKNCRVASSEHPLSAGIFSTLGKPFEIKSGGTFLINLSIDKNTIWEKTNKHSVQKNVERAQERGVYVKEMNRSDLAVYHKMVVDFNKEGYISDLSGVETRWDILHPVGWTGFLAYQNEIPVGGILTPSFNGYITEVGVARTEIDRASRLYSHDLLKWKIIEWGINNKYRYYDLTGVNPDPSDKKESGIFRYKEKFGGDFVKYNLIKL